MSANILYNQIELNDAEIKRTKGLRRRSTSTVVATPQSIAPRHHVVKITNVRLVRDGKLVNDELWVQDGKIINSFYRFFKYVLFVLTRTTSRGKCATHRRIRTHLRTRACNHTHTHTPTRTHSHTRPPTLTPTPTDPRTTPHPSYTHSRFTHPRSLTHAHSSKSWEEYYAPDLEVDGQGL